MRLSVTDFRNVAAAVLEPDPQLTVLCGPNGQGKTNLLEAVWMLTGAKSFRAAKDAELIRRGTGFAVLAADFEGVGRAQTLRLTVGGSDSQRPGRTVKLNGADRGRAAAIAGTFTAVVFTPDHLRLVKDGPDGRRRFVDAALCQCQPAHLAALRRYQRALAQKNALLKHFDETRDSPLVLDTLNAALAESGGAVMARRDWFLRQLAPLAAANYAEISSGAEDLRLQYLPSAAYELGQEPGEALAAKLAALRSAEIRAGFSLTGPHRDDVSIFIGGTAGRVYGSELDDARQTYLLTHIGGKQTIVTTCDSAAFARTNGKLVHVKEGKIL